MGQHVVLQAGHLAELTLVVGRDRLTGAAVLPHVLKTCRDKVLAEKGVCSVEAEMGVVLNGGEKA